MPGLLPGTSQEFGAFVILAWVTASLPRGMGERMYRCSSIRETGECGRGSQEQQLLPRKYPTTCAWMPHSKNGL